MPLVEVVPLFSLTHTIQVVMHLGFEPLQVLLVTQSRGLEFEEQGGEERLAVLGRLGLVRNDLADESSDSPLDDEVLDLRLDSSRRHVEVFLEINPCEDHLCGGVPERALGLRAVSHGRLQRQTHHHHRDERPNGFFGRRDLRAGVHSPSQIHRFLEAVVRVQVQKRHGVLYTLFIHCRLFSIEKGPSLARVKSLTLFDLSLN